MQELLYSSGKSRPCVTFFQQYFLFVIYCHHFNIELDSQHQAAVSSGTHSPTQTVTITIVAISPKFQQNFVGKTKNVLIE